MESIKQDFTWSGHGEYLAPAICKSWNALALLSHNDRLNETDFTYGYPYKFHRCRPKFSDVLKRIHYEAQRHGMSMPKPTRIQIKSSGLIALREELEIAKEASVQFLFVVHPDTADEIHNYLKVS